MASTVLSPCPFCGHQNAAVVMKHGVPFLWAECVTCGARGPDCDNEPAAERSWNKRAPDSKSIAELTRPPVPSERSGNEQLEDDFRAAMRMVWGLAILQAGSLIAIWTLVFEFMK